MEFQVHFPAGKFHPHPAAIRRDGVRTYEEAVEGDRCGLERGLQPQGDKLRHHPKAGVVRDLPVPYGTVQHRTRQRNSTIL
jgi:hypothetical protein